MPDFNELYEKAVSDSDELYKLAFNPVTGIETVITHGGHDPLSLPDMGNPIVTPITLSTTFQQLEPATGKVCRN